MLVILLLLGAVADRHHAEILPGFIIPPPQAVAEKFVEVLLDGRLWLHTQVTLAAVLAGLGIGLSIGVVLGYADRQQSSCWSTR